jgi:hypothetical protein
MYPFRLIMWLITRNKYVRQIFSVMDAIFYEQILKPSIGLASRVGG